MVEWTPKTIGMVRRLAKAGLSGKEIADAMTVEFGKPVSRNGIAGLCHRNNIPLRGQKSRNFLEHPPPSAQVAARRLLVASKVSKAPKPKPPKQKIEKGNAVRKSKPKLALQPAPKSLGGARQGMVSPVEDSGIDDVPSEAVVPDIKSSGLRDPARCRATYAAKKGETCTFPFGEPKHPDYRLCGEEAKIGPYCKTHALICVPGLVRRLDELGIE